MEQISNKQFLQAVLGEYWQAAHCTGFGEDPSQLDSLGLRHYWGGQVYARVPVEIPEWNNFFVISTFWPDDEDGKQRRRKANFAAAYCMMLDDIGEGPGAKISSIDMLSFPILPSWKLETSPDNYQYGYIFDEPCMDRILVEALLKGFVSLGLVDSGEDPGMLGCTRYARLPVGSNTKAKYGTPFKHRLAEWEPDRKYSVQALAAAFGFEIQDFYHEQDITEPLPMEEDLVYQSLDRLGLVKGKLRQGIYDIVCPWISDHSDRADSGAAYLSPMGFKCHHGHCASRSGRDLLNYLHGADPEYVAACNARLPFLAQEPAATPDAGGAVLQPEHHQPEAGDFEVRFKQALHSINPNDPKSVEAVFLVLAEALPRLAPSEKDHYLRLIKEEAQITIKVAREQLKHTRYALLKAHKEKGILHEPQWVVFRSDDGSIVPCMDNFRAICEFIGVRLSYNQMSHTIDLETPERTFSTEDIDNLNLMYMRDLVQRFNFPFSRVGEWMVGVAHESAYHPFRDYLDAQAHRNFDPTCPTFEKVMRTLEFQDFPEQSRVFVMRWLISVIAAVRGHGRAGLKGVLTFAGRQGIGKTSWFRNLMPDGMFTEGVTLDPHNKDTLIKATKYLVCELGELDATFKRDIPALKAFISNQNDEIRHPYAAKSSLHPRRTVFCATVNQSDFLVDQTGNSRFWPVGVTSCGFKDLELMRETGELDQFWFEVDQMYKAGIQGRPEYRWWIDAEEAGMLSEVSEQYVRHTAGETLLRERFDMDGPVVHEMSIDEIMETCGLHINDSQYAGRKREILDALRRITGQANAKRVQKNGRRQFCYKVPQTRMASLIPEMSVVGKAAIDDFL